VQWRDLLTALCLVLVVEGLFPFLSPQRFRRSMLQVARIDDRALRAVGLASMAAGAGLLYVVR
jgi:hypothetical protein